MNKSLVSLCITSLVCSGMIAQSLETTPNEQQQDSMKLQQLDEVVVSDSRFALKRENSGKTVIKITSEELEKSQGKSIAEIINTKSGIEITGSRGREGAVLGVFARGGRGRQVLIIVDGVRVADPSSASSEYDLRLLSTASVASIEIIKGAASTLYGTNAATAVISITTKNATEQGTALSVQSSMGTNQTVEDQNFNASDFSNNVQLDGMANKFSYAARFSHTNSRGLSAIRTDQNEEDVFSRFSADLRLGYQFSENFKVAVYGNQTKLASDFDESFGLIDADYSYLNKQERLGLSSTFNYGDSGTIVLNAAQTSFNSESKSAFPNTFEGKNLVVDVYNKLRFNTQWYTVLGLNYIKDETEFLANQTFEIIDPYVNVVYVSDFGLNLNIGARSNNHSEYGSHFVYNFNPSYTIKTDQGYMKFMGSYATSYITPSLIQLFGNFGANPDLEPEDNRTIEGGFEYAVSEKLRFSSLYFNRKEENFVFYDSATSTYNNAVNTIDAQGVEVELNWKPYEELSLNANYTFTERNGDNAIRIPKHKINAVIGYEFSERANATLGYSLTGERSDTDFSSFPFEDVALESFSIVDLYFGFDMIPNKLKIFANANNLLNTTYTEVLGFTTRGRNIRIGFYLNL